MYVLKTSSLIIISETNNPQDQLSAVAHFFFPLKQICSYDMKGGFHCWILLSADTGEVFYQTWVKVGLLTRTKPIIHCEK